MKKKLIKIFNLKMQKKYNNKKINKQKKIKIKTNNLLNI